MSRLHLCLLVLGLSFSAGAATPEQDVSWGEIQQTAIPSLQGRQAAAERAVALREQWRDGQVSFETAFPELAGAPLDSPAAIRGRLRKLEDAAIERSAEAQQTPPDLGAADRVDTFEVARQLAHDAESKADQAEKQLLVAIFARLQAHPELSAAALSSERDQLRALADAGGDDTTDALALAADLQLRRLDQHVNALLRAATGAPLTLDIDGDLAALDTDPGAALRLSLAWPFLDVSNADTVDGALSLWWTDRPEPALSDDQLAQIEALIPDDHGTAAWQEARRQTWTAWIEQGPSEPDEPTPTAPVDSEDQAAQVDRAIEEAEAARADAEDALAQRRADLNVGLARARKRVASVRDRAVEREAEANKISQDIDNEIALFQADVRALEDRRRSVDADASYRRARELSSALRLNSAAWGEPLIRARSIASTVEASVDEDSRRISQAQGLVRTTDDVMLQEQLRSQLEIWSGLLDEEEAGATDLVDAAIHERDAVLRGLGEVRESRKALYPWISRAERDNDYRYLFEDVVQELSLLGPSLWMRLRERGNDLLALPGRLTNYNVVRSGFIGAFWLIVGLGLWAWARGQANETARIICDRIRALRPELRRSDMVALRDPVARFLRALVDLLLGYLLVTRLGAVLPEVGLLVRVYLQWVLFGALLAGFDLCVVPIDQVRPAFLLLRREAWTLARTSFSWLAGLLIARRFAAYLLWDVLGLDVVAGLVAYAFWLALLGASVRLLHLWQPFLQRRVALRNLDSAVVSFLAKDPESDLIKAMRSVGILAFFAADSGRNLLWMVARERSGIAWLMHAATRFRGADEEQRFTCVDASITDKIAGGSTEPAHWIERPELKPEIAKALVAWREEDRRGLVAVVGDRGCGKETACAQVAGLLRDSGLPPTEVELRDHLLTEAQGLAWLSSVAGLPTADSAADLVTAIDALPRQAFVLRGLHRAWSRRVEGFAAIKILLYVLNATSDNHFWVVSMHKASWDFFAASGSSVDVGVFRTVVALQPMTADQLRIVTTGRAERAGYTLDYSALVRTSPFGGDQAVEEERSVHMFFRLLAGASDGSARVALSLWGRCLSPTDDPQVLAVRIHPSLNGAGVLDLADTALFALVALRIQDELNPDELQEVTNLPPHVVRATVRDLMSRGLVALDGEQLSIPDLLLPVVTRTLRRRHFLHVGG